MQRTHIKLELFTSQIFRTLNSHPGNLVSDAMHTTHGNLAEHRSWSNLQPLPTISTDPSFILIEIIINATSAISQQRTFFGLQPVPSIIEAQSAQVLMWSAGPLKQKGRIAGSRWPDVRCSSPALQPWPPRTQRRPLPMPAWAAWLQRPLLRSPAQPHTKTSVMSDRVSQSLHKPVLTPRHTQWLALHIPVWHNAAMQIQKSNQMHRPMDV